MLRIYFMQQWYGLSDPAMEDSLYDVESMRRFAGVNLDHIPDETTIYKFRHFLERHRLTAILFRRTEQYLSDRGLLLSEGTIVDATIVQAPLFDQEPGPATGPGDGLYEERDHLALRSESARGERSPGASALRGGDLGVGA